MLGVAGMVRQESLRMSRDTFNVLCQELRSHVERQETRLRMPIGVEKRVAVTILKLVTNVEYWTILALFGLGHCLCHCHGNMHCNS